jgi:hypothetical protein
MPSDGLSSPVRPYYLPPPEFPSVWGALADGLRDLEAALERKRQADALMRSDSVRAEAYRNLAEARAEAARAQAEAARAPGRTPVGGGWGRRTEVASPMSAEEALAQAVQLSEPYQHSLQTYRELRGTDGPDVANDFWAHTEPIARVSAIRQWLVQALLEEYFATEQFKSALQRIGEIRKTEGREAADDFQAAMLLMVDYYLTQRWAALTPRPSSPDSSKGDAAAKRRPHW